MRNLFVFGCPIFCYFLRSFNWLAIYFKEEKIQVALDLKPQNVVNKKIVTAVSTQKPKVICYHLCTKADIIASHASGTKALGLLILETGLTFVSVYFLKL